jgi:AcrR family transcriptional regulator
MGRAVRHPHTTILDSAKRVSARLGPQKLTIAAVADDAGAPVGSIYHRYASRDDILAAVWLDLVEEFQTGFLAHLESGEPVAAGLAAMRFVCRWVRRHPREARLMLLHRREDFAADRWAAAHRQRAHALAKQANETLRRYAIRLLGGSGPGELRRVRFALVDLPTAALKRDLEAGAPPSKHMEALLLETCAYALRRRVRTRPTST